MNTIRKQFAFFSPAGKAFSKTQFTAGPEFVWITEKFIKNLPKIMLGGGYEKKSKRDQWLSLKKHRARLITRSASPSEQARGVLPSCLMSLAFFALNFLQIFLKTQRCSRKTKLWHFNRTAGTSALQRTYGLAVICRILNKWPDRKNMSI